MTHGLRLLLAVQEQTGVNDSDSYLLQAEARPGALAPGTPLNPFVSEQQVRFYCISGHEIGSGVRLMQMIQANRQWSTAPVRGFFG